MVTTTHRYTIAEDGESIVCECGNTPFDSGFYPCLPDGTRVEPTIESDWNNHYQCDDCGLIHEACRAAYGDYCECPECTTTESRPLLPNG